LIYYRSSSTIDEALGKSTHFSDRGGRGGRGRGAGRGRGRGRGRGLVIVDDSTASGIFSLGPSAVSRGRMGAGGGAFASYGGDVPSRTETGEEEESDMVELFTKADGKDTPVTFRHVSRLEGDIDPVTLEQTIGRIPWMTVKSTPPKKDTIVQNVKKEEGSDDVDMDANEKEAEKEPIVPDTEEEQAEELPKLYMDSDSPAQNIFALDEKHRLVCVAEEELLYFQLPTVVPKFEKIKIDEPMEGEQDEEEKVKSEESASLPASAKKSTLLEDAMSNLGLEDIPQGQVGTLIMYKSGKMKMKFGSILLDVNQGMQSSFLENVMVVDHESEETKKAIELGHIVQKFVCAPNMDALLSAEEEALI
jgi:archaellum component FlaD/FlaE